jgi:hypothetical protein
MVRETSNTGGSPEPRPVCTLARALWGEFEAIHGEPQPAMTDHSPNREQQAYQIAAAAKNQAALCLSGGGIRSAAFSLGVLQALARKGLLTQFHYLSTVSGGGYIGGWLTALIHERNGDVGSVQDLLAAVEAPEEIQALRGFTNFLTPQVGLASPDTWTGITLWVRNVLVNWMLFLPGLFALSLAPVFYRDLIRDISPAVGLGLLVIGLISLFIGVYNGAVHLPSHAPETDRIAGTATNQRPSFAVLWVVLPILLWAILVPLIAAPSLRLVMPLDTVSAAQIPFGSFVVMILAYVVAGFSCGPDDRRVFRRNLLWWFIAAGIASLLLDVGITLGLNQPPAVLAVVGPLWVTLAHLAQSLFYVALRREALRGELDREWLGRLSASKVMPSVGWGLFATICLLVPMLIALWTSSIQPWVVGVIGVVTGPGAALLGKSTAATAGRGGKDAVAGPRLSVTAIVALATAVFAVVLFMTLSRAGDALTEAFAPDTKTAGPAYRWIVDLAFLLGSLALALGLGRRINVNRFSMHGTYRNRLVRAFLGTARIGRRPDSFTGIDPADNPRMDDLFNRPPGSRALFPVLNLTLNVTHVTNNAWAERKAASFTVTPLRSGSADLHRIEDIAAGKPVCGAYARTDSYAGEEKETGPADAGNGITLGTAFALSGAAVSPNMGYHSSAATAFLMTLFNVRLGAWLPNPAVASATALRRAKPPNALITLARELLGRSDDVGRAVYLSDGGHFDDLGLYEMIRRRCRHIIVVDAGQDENAQFTDLGNAARKVFIDFGVRIVFKPAVAIGSRSVPINPVRGSACADIHYPEGGPVGKLIYLRPCDLPDVQIDVRSYRNANMDFPHESTLDQWFSESRFESYRGLGDTEMSNLGPPPGGRDGASLPDFFAFVHERIVSESGIEFGLATAGDLAAD